MARDLSCGDARVYVVFEFRRVSCQRCGKVKQEGLEWLSDNPCYTKRFAYQVGERCRDSSLQAVAEEYHLNWKTVKELDKRYMQEQWKRAPAPAPRVIGIDEISVKKGHRYRIVVSDLEAKRPIWMGGKDRSETSMDQFYEWLGPEKSSQIRLAVMDMWKPFRQSKNRNAPQAETLFDKFHVLTHLNDAIDAVRKSEYRRLTKDRRKFVKGQKYALLSRRRNLTSSGRKNLKILFAANQRLHTAYLLKESFVQLWEYQRKTWAKKFFDNWKDALKWKRIKPFQDFAKMIERHWDGITTYCKSENKVALGYVEGLNNKIRVLQRRAYGIRDEEYLKLKVLTCQLPPLDPP